MGKVETTVRDILKDFKEPIPPLTSSATATTNTTIFGVFFAAISTDPVDEEIRKHLLQSTDTSEIIFLAWWVANKLIYPLFYQAHLKIGCVLATSVPSK